MIKEIDKNNVAECVEVIRKSFLTIAEQFGFFPFTCGYMVKELKPQDQA